jgi:hypothetical protein
MNVGKLYQVKKFYWMLYPSKDVAAHADAHTAGALSSDASIAAAAAAYYGPYFNCIVSYISSGSIFVFLEQDGKCCKVLSDEGNIGWIYLAELYKNYIEEMNQ